MFSIRQSRIPLAGKFNNKNDIESEYETLKIIIQFGGSKFQFDLNLYRWHWFEFGTLGKLD